MRYPNAVKGIKKIYLAEILGILAVVLAIVMVIMVAGSHVDTSISGEEAAQALQAVSRKSTAARTDRKRSFSTARTTRSAHRIQSNA